MARAAGGVGDSGAALRVYKGLHRGLNAIDYDRFRWLNTVAIYYPDAAAAQRVLDAYVESDRVTHFDIFLSTHGS